MKAFDVAKGTSLRHKISGDCVDVLQVTEGRVKLDRWNAGTQECCSIESVLLEFDTLVEPDALPVLAVEPLVDNAKEIARAVRVVVIEPHPAFMDDDEPLTLRASQAGLPVLDAYLAAVVAGDAWLDRESGGTASLRESPLETQPGWTVSLLSATYSKRYPSHWFAVVVFNDSVCVPELTATVRSEHLANQLFQAIVAGDVQLTAE